MFGDASKPITLPGLIYVALQFLRGFDQDINLNLPSPDAQPEINIDPNLPSADKCGPDSNWNTNADLIIAGVFKKIFIRKNK